MSQSAWMKEHGLPRKEIPGELPESNKHKNEGFDSNSLGRAGKKSLEKGYEQSPMDPPMPEWHVGYGKEIF